MWPKLDHDVFQILEACTMWLNIINAVTLLGAVHIQSKWNFLKLFSSCIRLREEQGNTNKAKIKQNKKYFCITHKLLLILPFYISYKPIIIWDFFNGSQFYDSSSLFILLILFWSIKKHKIKADSKKEATGIDWHL